MTDLGHPSIRRPGRSLASIVNWAAFDVRAFADRVLVGMTNNAGTFTLATSGLTTTVTDARVGVNSKIVFSPTNADGASMEGLGTYVSSVTNGSFVLTHAESSASRSYAYHIAG